MEGVFLKLANMSITATWLVLAVVAARQIMKKAPRWIFCLLWGLVAVRLVCPVTIESSLSLIPDPEPLAQEIIYTGNISGSGYGGISGAGRNTAPDHAPIVNDEVPDREEDVTAGIDNGEISPEKEQKHGWAFFLSRIWCAGVAGMIAYMAVSYILVKKKVAAAIPLVRGVKQSECVEDPFVLGILRPVIYLPFCMAEEDIPYVIAHEQAHIRRRDHWWKPLGFLLLSVYWFNPVLWAAYILLCRDIEAACDEKVIRVMDVDGRRAYSAALLNCSVRRRGIAACPLAFGEVGVKARVKSVMHYRKPAFWVIAAAFAVSVLVAVCFLTDPVNEIPVTMQAVYADRTHGVLEFVFDDSLAGKDIRISEEYALETLEQGKWTELRILSDWPISEVVYLSEPGDPEANARTAPDWEDAYGALPDGTYRIKKDVDISPGFRKGSVYAEFTIGNVSTRSDVYSENYNEQYPKGTALEAMTNSVTHVSIWTGKMVSLSSGENFQRILAMLRDLEGGTVPATKEEAEAVQAVTYDLTNVIISDTLGEKTIVFSPECRYVWEFGSEEVYRITEPAPLRQFIEGVTNGVRNRQVSGALFAAVNAPWDWCAGIDAGAVESAQAHVCLNTYSNGSTDGSSSKNGWLSQDTLDQLIRILNQIPKDAFTSHALTSKPSYQDLFINQATENSSVSVIDGVNDMAVLIRCKKGRVTMLLTGELENVCSKSSTRLNTTEIWEVEDAALAEFMQEHSLSQQLITYFVGGEYDWQPPLPFEKDGFTLNLRLIEGWEFEYAADAASSGIRCRPAGSTEGWLYFSYWPEEYEPAEEDRYIAESAHLDWQTYTSFASKDVQVHGGIATTGKVWSYERYDLEKGDYVIINDGADSWFAEYIDQIEDTIVISEIAVK